MDTKPEDDAKALRAYRELPATTSWLAAHARTETCAPQLSRAEADDVLAHGAATGATLLQQRPELCVAAVLIGGGQVQSLLAYAVNLGDIACVVSLIEAGVPCGGAVVQAQQGSTKATTVDLQTAFVAGAHLAAGLPQLVQLADALEAQIARSEALVQGGEAVAWAPASWAAATALLLPVTGRWEQLRSLPEAHRPCWDSHAQLRRAITAVLKHAPDQLPTLAREVHACTQSVDALADIMYDVAGDAQCAALVSGLLKADKRVEDMDGCAQGTDDAECTVLDLAVQAGMADTVQVVLAGGATLPVPGDGRATLGRSLQIAAAKRAHQDSCDLVRTAQVLRRVGGFLWSLSSAPATMENGKPLPLRQLTCPAWSAIMQDSPLGEALLEHVLGRHGVGPTWDPALALPLVPLTPASVTPCGMRASVLVSPLVAAVHVSIESAMKSADNPAQTRRRALLGALMGVAQAQGWMASAPPPLIVLPQGVLVDSPADREAAAQMLRAALNLVKTVASEMSGLAVTGLNTAHWAPTAVRQAVWCSVIGRQPGAAPDGTTTPSQRALQRHPTVIRDAAETARVVQTCGAHGWSLDTAVTAAAATVTGRKAKRAATRKAKKAKRKANKGAAAGCSGACATAAAAPPVPHWLDTAPAVPYAAVAAVGQLRAAGALAL